MYKRLWRRLGKAVIASALVMGALAGCEKTPEDSIIREKGSKAIKGYESLGEDEGVLFSDKLNIPDHYTNNASYEDGALIIDTNAQVIVPNVTSVDTIIISAVKADSSLLDTVMKAFFGDGKVYDAAMYMKHTKEQLQNQLTQLKKYKAEGNLDPYNYGKDENGNLQYDIDADIERYENEINTAPENVEKKEIKPEFGIEYYDEKTGKTEKMDQFFGGIVEMNNGNYDYMANISGPDVNIRISKIRTDLPDLQEFSDWQEGEYIMDNDGPNSMSEDEIKQLIKIPYEDAKKQAEDYVGKLGWDLELYNYDYALFYHGEEGVKKENVLEGGYLFHFTRVVQNVPLTYTSEYGGGLEDMDSTLVPWSYERCDIIIGDNGFAQAEIISPYNVGDVQTKNVKLMDFESIMKIYEQMMEVSNVDITNYEKKRTYHIKKITLGYSRIYNPEAKNNEGLLVPVWDFFGAFDMEGEMVEQDEFGRRTTPISEKHSGEHSNRSFLTINAIDGTVIDRSLGY